MRTLDEEFFGSIEDLHALIDLENEHCHLKHSEEDPSENHQAVDYLRQKLGYEVSTDNGNSANEDIIQVTIRIPICQECVDALLGEDWILFYCVHCNSSQWLNRRYAKNMYPFWLHIKWMDACPICHEAKLKLEQP